MEGRIQGEASAPRESRHDYWGVVLEAPDVVALARFYADMLGWNVVAEEDDWATVAPPDGVAYLAFQLDPDYVPPVWPAAEGAQRMMMHLDLEVSDLEAAVAGAVRLGATQAQFQPQETVRVMLDPAGHPFCLYTSEG